MVAMGSGFVPSGHVLGLPGSATFLDGFNRRGFGRDGREVSVTTDSVTEAIIGDAIAVHREMGPGMLESTYEACLATLLFRRGLSVERQVALPAMFLGERLDCAFRIDLLVEKKVVVELKTVTKLEPVHMAQMNTYLKFSGCETGLLINFNVTRLVDGLRRMVRDYKGPSRPSRPSRNSAIESVEVHGGTR